MCVELVREQNPNLEPHLLLAVGAEVLDSRLLDKVPSQFNKFVETVTVVDK